MSPRTLQLHSDLSSPTFSTRRLALSRSVTLLEATDSPRQDQAAALLQAISEEAAGNKEGRSSFKIGLAGPPGAGKSTFIEALGKHILDFGEPDSDHSSSPKPSSSWRPSRVAVLTVDPSSSFTGGSILGDKTRMPVLSLHPNAFVRPSPSRLNLGGLAAYTSDVIQLCTHAGYDLVIVETVGLGQSEIEVDQAVDMLCLLVPPAGGDELQGSKKGIAECADAIVVNKADGDLLRPARHTAADYAAAVKWQGTGKKEVRGKWKVPVLLASAKEGEGIEEVFEMIGKFRETMVGNGCLEKKRRAQGKYWMWKNLQDLVAKRTREDAAMKEVAAALDVALVEARITPRNASRKLLEAFLESFNSNR